MRYPASARFGMRLQQERKRLGISQADLGASLRRAGVQVGGSALSRIESGQYGVRLDTAVAIAQILGCTLEHLMRPISPTEREIAELEERLAELRAEA